MDTQKTLKRSPQKIHKKTHKRGPQKKTQKKTQKKIKSYLIVGVMTAQQNNIYGIYIKNYFQTLLQMNNYLIS